METAKGCRKTHDSLHIIVDCNNSREKTSTGDVRGDVLHCTSKLEDRVPVNQALPAGTGTSCWLPSY
jgi:hypothetical protein